MLFLAAALSPQQVLDRYADALTAVKTPVAWTFEYAFEHHGDRPQERRHRVYREVDRERDEILSVNGERFARPQVRIFERRRDRYGVPVIAPNPKSYLFTFVGSERDGHHLDYVFKAIPRAAGAYEVTRLTIDGLSFLPRKVAFRSESRGVVGTGEITYAKAEQYWMPQEATARANVDGKLQTERILWARYRFYESLPPETFTQPRKQ